MKLKDSGLVPKNENLPLELIGNEYYSAIINAKFDVKYILRFLSVVISPTRNVTYKFMKEDGKTIELNTGELHDYQVQYVNLPRQAPEAHVRNSF